MGFGAVIASDGKILDESILNCLVEVRVEQTLDDPIAFAVRFMDDIEDGNLIMPQKSELKPGKIISIAVEQDTTLLCLVNGPIDQVKSQVTLGGPGSWFEVRGQDRRALMSRNCQQRVWEGKASDAFTEILEGYDFEADVEATSQDYSEDSGTLNQRSPDLDFITKEVKNNGLSFWITYDCAVSGDSLNITETAHVKASPPRSGGDQGQLDSMTEVQLMPSSELELRVHVSGDQCQNVTQFNFDMDVDQPTQYTGVTVNDSDGGEDEIQTVDPGSAMQDGGSGLADVTDQERELCITPTGGGEEAYTQAESALADAGWFMKATASTTAYMLRGILQPHDVLNVIGLGSQNSVPYQITAVNHVINAVDHFMDMELRTNVIVEV